MKTSKQDSFWGGVVRSMGIVFGDIGTSPIYTLTVVFALTPRTQDSVLGILSLVVWTLLILVTAEYAWLAMSLSYKGQGGEIMLREILSKALKPGRKLAFAGFLAFIGVSLLLGDGVITPAITILSAVEGILLVPGLENVRLEILILIAVTIAVVLFAVQSRGVDKVAGVFGPVMAVWFICLAVTGLASVVTMPGILKAVNPYYAFKFLSENGLAGFFVLSEVILCATGGEALYADMGHLGKKPILHAWYFVFAAVLLNYMGQGVFAIAHPEVKYLLFGMVQHQASYLYIPFLLLTVLPTIIVAADHQRNFFGRLPGNYNKDYAADEGCLYFQSDEIPDPYSRCKLDIDVRSHSHDSDLPEIGKPRRCLRHGGDRIDDDYRADDDSGVFTNQKDEMEAAHRHHRHRHRLHVFCGHLKQEPHGAYWSLILAAIPLTLILVWTKGQKRLFKSLRPLDLETFLIQSEDARRP